MSSYSRLGLSELHFEFARGILSVELKTEALHDRAHQCITQSLWCTGMNLLRTPVDFSLRCWKLSLPVFCCRVIWCLRFMLDLQFRLCQDHCGVPSLFPICWASPPEIPNSCVCYSCRFLSFCPGQDHFTVGLPCAKDPYSCSRGNSGCTDRVAENEHHENTMMWDVSSGWKGTVGEFITKRVYTVGDSMSFLELP